MSETNRRSGRIAQFISNAPFVSAMALLSAIGASGLFLDYYLADFGRFGQHLHGGRTLFEFTAGGLTGAVAVIAAFRIHILGRTTFWRAWPLTMLAIWQFASIYVSRDIPIVKPAEQVFFGQSPHSVLFILAASIPIVIAQFLMLRPARAQLSASAAALVGLGAASLSTSLMQLLYPVEMNLADVAMNFAAIGIVVGSTAYATQLQPRASADIAVQSDGRARKPPAPGSK